MAPSLALVLACSPDPPPPPARHALVLVIDTLRADVLAEVHTPTIDRLQSQGAAVPRAWSAGTWTVPSVISLMTGMGVRQHGWDLPTGRLGKYPLLPQTPTLAEVLAAEGFGTDGLAANGYLAEEIGFDRGFETWRRTVDVQIPGQVETLVREGWGDGRRHFLYVHLLGPHTPLRPSAESAARWGVGPEWLEGSRPGVGIGPAKRDSPPGARAVYGQAYRAVVEDTDARVAEILAALGPARGDTFVLLTSDHGELLGEHGKVGHGHFVWEPLTHVPLVVDHPHSQTEQLPATLGGASVPALVTAALGLSHPWPTGPAAALPLVSQREGKLALSPDGVWRAAWAPSLEITALGSAPGTPPTPDAMEAARAEFEARHPAAATPPSAVELRPDTQEALEVLGYIDNGESPAPARR